MSYNKLHTNTTPAHCSITLDYLKYIPTYMIHCLPDSLKILTIHIGFNGNAFQLFYEIVAYYPSRPYYYCDTILFAIQSIHLD